MNCVKKKKEVNYMNKTELWNYLGKVEIEINKKERD